MLAHLFRGYPLGGQCCAESFVSISCQAVRPRDIEEIAYLPLGRNFISIQRES